jgi:hypothetical protein
VLIKLSNQENLNKLKELEKEIKHLAKLDKINFISNENDINLDDFKFNSINHKLNENINILIKYKVRKKILNYVHFLNLLFKLFYFKE